LARDRDGGSPGGSGAAPWPAGFKQCGLNLNAAAGGIGENEPSAETERGAGGFHRVAAGGDVVTK